MTDKKLNLHSVGIMFRSLALLLVVALFITSTPVAIALENTDALKELTEQEFILSPEDGVTVTLSGMMPVGGSADAKTADVDDESVLHAYDITIYYANGSEFEPDADSPINVSFKSDAIAEAIEDADTSLEVEHIADNGEQETVELVSADGDSGEAVFEAESFSVYLIKTHTEDTQIVTARKTFHFLSPNYTLIEEDGASYYQSTTYQFLNKNNDLVTTQTVTNGESLQEIMLPYSNTGGSFYGWYIVHLRNYDEANDLYEYYWGSEEPQRLKFNEPVSVTESEDTDVYVAPIFNHYRFLTFHQDIEGSALADTIITRKLVTLNENHQCTLTVSDVRAPSSDPNRIVFWGWEFTHLNDDGSKGETEIIHTVDNDSSEIKATVTITDHNEISGHPTEEQLRRMIFDIYPIFREARWLYFDTGEGATNVPAQFNLIDEPPSSFTNIPTRPGYAFEGWYFYKVTDGAVTEEIKITNEYGIITCPDRQLTDSVKIENGKLVLDKSAPSGTFHAKWRANGTADYYVVVWKQSVNDDKDASADEKTYDYYESYLLENATVGQKADETTQFNNGHYNQLTTYDTENFNGFTYAKTSFENGYGTAKNQVNPDGSTIVNVYYDRKVVTLTFNAGSGYTADNTNGMYGRSNNNYFLLTKNGSNYYFLSSSSRGSSPYTGTIYTRNGSSYVEFTGTPVYGTTYYYQSSSWWSTNYNALSWVRYTGTRYSPNIAYSYSDLYGKKIISIFNQAPLGTTYKGYIWEDLSQTVYTEKVMSIELMPASDVNFTVNSTGGTYNTMYYYLEVYPGDSYDRTYDGRNYKLYNSITLPNSWYPTYEEDYYPIDGFNRNKNWAEPTFNSSGTGSFNRNRAAYFYYHRRTDLEFTYDFNYNTENNQHKVTGITYEAPLQSFADYTPPEREHYHFVGWYADKLGVVPYNFNNKMPSNNLVAYAKWELVKYNVTINPNYGEFPIGSDYYTYLSVDYGSKVPEYSSTKRDYVEAENGEYVYFCADYDKIKNMTGSDGNPLDLPKEYRRAFYIKRNEIDATYSRVYTLADGSTFSFANSGLSLEQFRSLVDMNKLYNKIENGEEIFKLVAWNKVENGRIKTEPYNFNDIVEGEVNISARWVSPGRYSIAYNPTMTGNMITGDMLFYNDPNDSGLKYTDGSNVAILQEPTNVRYGSGNSADNYTFRGWRVVDGVTREPLEDDVFYDPGDDFAIKSSLADADGVIHMEAYYEKTESTIRRVDVTALTLDANDEDASVNRNGLANDKYEYADIINKKVVLDLQNNNFDVDLSKYINNFSHNNGHLLLGWNETPDSGNYIPKYYADAVVGVNKENMPNILYAVWEPMVYFNLKNKTSQTISLTLTFAHYEGNVYLGNTNSVEGKYSRTEFSEYQGVTQTSPGVFTVELPVDADYQLVLPQGENFTYSVTGTNNLGKTMYIYNSGGVSSSYGRNARYNASGTLKLGKEGQLVAFYEENPTTEITLEARYYDLTTGAWENDTAEAADAKYGFSKTPTGATVTAGSKISMTAINNRQDLFSFKVNSYDSQNYKFIGWYSVGEAGYNEYSIDGKAAELGDAEIKDLTVPVNATIYYALFVPYVSRELVITHSERDNTAGHCADENGLSLNVAYDDVNETVYGDRDTPATYTVPASYIDERNTSGTITVTTGATPHEGSIYVNTYRDVYEFTGNTGTFNVPDLFTDSPTVKGLKELAELRFYSVFARGYEITYKYTARNGEKKNYVIKGNAETFDDFASFVIEKTPYERTLRNDIVWDTENMDITETEYGMTAVLEEKASTPDRRTVTIIEAGGYVPTERVLYGETFTEEQAERHRAPSTNDQGQQFEYWDIKNTDTGEHIANCYSERFTFMVWNNYTITPHYSDNPQQKEDEGTFVTIDYIDTSRNSWGLIDNDEKDITDKIVVDFDLAFIDGKEKMLESTHQYNLGVLFEIAGTTEDGTFDSSTYTEDEEKAKSRVTKIVSSTRQNNGKISSKGVPVAYYGKIDINEDTVSNFNRSEYAYDFTSSEVQNFVFRMYAYMVKEDGTVVLSNPRYFSVYDYAVRQYAVQGTGPRKSPTTDQSSTETIPED